MSDALLEAPIEDNETVVESPEAEAPATDVHSLLDRLLETLNRRIDTSGEQSTVDAARRRLEAAQATVGEWEGKLEAARRQADEAETGAGDAILEGKQTAEDAAATIAASRSLVAAVERGLQSARHDAELASLQLSESQVAERVALVNQSEAIRQAQYSAFDAFWGAVRRQADGDYRLHVTADASPTLDEQNRRAWVSQVRNKNTQRRRRLEKLANT